MQEETSVRYVECCDRAIKTMERQGKPREDICAMLKERFGEKNPDVRV